MNLLALFSDRAKFSLNIEYFTKSWPNFESSYNFGKHFIQFFSKYIVFRSKCAQWCKVSNRNDVLDDCFDSVNPNPLEALQVNLYFNENWALSVKKIRKIENNSKWFIKLNKISNFNSKEMTQKERSRNCVQWIIHSTLNRLRQYNETQNRRPTITPWANFTQIGIFFRT